MAYTSMKKLILNKNAQYDNGKVTAAQYNTWKEQQMKKIDVFLACDRITADEYEELVGLFYELD